MVAPTEWIDRFGSIVTAAGGDKAAALQRTAANGRKVWECFMLGVDPTKADDDFKIMRFWMEGGRLMFEFSHSTDGVGNSFVPRLKVKGKVELSDGWLLTADGKPSVTGHGRRNLPPLAEVYIQCKEPCGCKQKVANFG